MDPENKETIENESFSNALSSRYLSYALSTIMSRSLPDVRDGLKPVHRRLLYAMHELKLDPKSGFKKCARVVGDVIGKFHPHGDAAVYDTLVRLAQDFSLRYPLIEGQGNFGSIDGDNAAAMRYTESKLTYTSTLLLADLENETVGFRPNYDGSDQEPEVLPALFPNLLANGSEGIAVGMATSIPPHNILEICDALIALSHNAEISHEQLTNFIIGPDFPTGGLMYETRQSITETYKTGKGSFKIRARWEIENLSHNMYQIIITEIPYQVNKSRLIEKLADLLKDKRLALIGNIRDESTEDIRIIIEPKNKGVDAELLMESLYKLTELETRFNLNLNVLDPNLAPRVMSLKEVLSEFLKFRREIITKRSQFRLRNINDRLETLAGLLIAHLNIDHVIKIIRESDEPKAELIKTFSITEKQAEAILNIRLRSLRKLEEIEIKKEQDSLNSEKQELESILNDTKKLEKVLNKEIKELKTNFEKNPALSNRRTEIIDQELKVVNINIDAFIEKEPITVIISQKGWLKSLKGHQSEISDNNFKDGDNVKFILPTHNTEKIIVSSLKGKFFTLNADKIPSGKGAGEPIRIILDLVPEDDILEIFEYNPEHKILLASSNNKGFITEMSNVIAQTKNGKQIADISGEDKLIFVQIIKGDMVAVIGQNRKLLIFPITQIPVMRKGQGVTLQKYKDGNISDITIFNQQEGLKYGNKTLTDLTPYTGNRASVGRMAPLGMPRNNKFRNIREG
ncbi:DNA topoisomerase IV subunit A [Rickettsiales endosymbiont of Stachyamoeba lipophora]|uniref:DNA topoisomerase IV subunit A n=1 Tax=Rickettsiales endosymbiont of Stachyamoeba lipophora TaxID=2486578 RepID=UPI000F653380|nr:DNA topoisomerase IV subunit A [Rickettsiales endosymbiont of Stachyamoeba lipophora]AZL15892.1 DNA topoisomerase IV subunit A [Rickettsiales endosymbiont of Stachyamoeba lipophora]